MTDMTGMAQGSVGDSTRATYCMATTQQKLSTTMDEVYVAHTMTLVTTARAAVIVDRLKQAMDRRLRSVTWLSPRAKQDVLATLTDLTVTFSAQSSRQDYTGVMLSLSDFQQNLRAVEHLPQSAKHTAGILDLMGLLRVPEYVPFGVSEVRMTAAVLAPPFLDTTDVAGMYGTMGFMIGHEMGHNFAGPSSAWTLRDSSAFSQREQRLLAPYDLVGFDRTYAHQVPDEHIADFIGIRLAYDALELALQGQPRPRIDGRTPEQRFFLAVARGMQYMYAADAEGGPLLKQMLGRPESLHALQLLRTNLMLASLPAFQQAFGCHDGDAMVWTSPNRPVELW